MTDAERWLWSRMRAKQIKGHLFYRQKTIGDSIVDFYCPKMKLVVEIDGGQHYRAEGRKEDRTRDDDMAGLGLTVLRFSDIEVLKNPEVVLEKIWSL